MITKHTALFFSIILSFSTLSAIYMSANSSENGIQNAQNCHYNQCYIPKSSADFWW